MSYMHIMNFEIANEEKYSLWCCITYLKNVKKLTTLCLFTVSFTYTQ